MIKRILVRSREIIRNKGIKAYISYIRSSLYWTPFIDELWYMINYYLRPSRKAIKKVQGSKMLLDLSDKGINRDLFLYGCREPECTQIFKSELSEGMKVVDIGANIGYYVLMEAQIIGDTGIIYAIEPAPRNFEALTENIQMNPYASRVKLYNMAISNKSGKILFTIADSANHHRLFVPGSPASRPEEHQNVIEVDTATLDEVLGGKDIDVIRMDTEGAEWVILKGMKKILGNDKPMKLFIEVHPKLIREYGGDVEAWLEVLAIAGFKVKYLVMYEPLSHFLIPYIKGRCALEKTVEYNASLHDLLVDEEARQFLVSRSGHLYEAGYKLFLDRSINGTE